jgi:hypothetical protein
MKYKNIILLKTASLTFVIIFILSCSPQDKKWKDVVKINNIASYESYIKEYPNGKYLSNANDSIESIDFKSTIKTAKLASFENFINKHPNGKLLNIAKDSMTAIEWNKVKNTDIFDPIQYFIDKYPKSKFQKEANFLIESIRYKPDRNTIYECILTSTKIAFSNPNSTANLKPIIDKVYEYDKKKGFLRVDGSCIMFSGSVFVMQPKYYKFIG